MKYRISTPKVTALALLAITTLVGCRPASYEIIRKMRNDERGDQPPGNFQNPEAPKPNGPQANLPPTARVEVIWNEQAVTRVKKNEPTTIRPSLDTVDADDVGVSSCVNPGIVKADYKINPGEVQKSANRPQGCEALGVPYVFTEVGEYKVGMTVTSNENETAYAEITLMVYDDDSAQPDGGFEIFAEPMIAKVNQEFKFWGVCTFGKTQTITWNFGDDGKGSGKVVQHAYSKTGQYRVVAICTDENNRQKSATITVVVTDKEIKIPGLPPKSIPPEGGEQPPKDPPKTEVPPSQVPGQGPEQDQGTWQHGGWQHDGWRHGGWQHDGKKDANKECCGFWCGW